jgi:hypothetical protein
MILKIICDFSKYVKKILQRSDLHVFFWDKSPEILAWSVDIVGSDSNVTLGAFGFLDLVGVGSWLFSSAFLLVMRGCGRSLVDPMNDDGEVINNPKNYTGLLRVSTIGRGIYRRPLPTSTLQLPSSVL